MTQTPMPEPFTHLNETGYILAIIASQLEDTGSPETRAEHPAAYKYPLTTTPSFEHLRQAMQSETQSYLETVTRELKRELFILTPSQFRTLQSIDLPPTLIESVASLNFLKLRTAPYPVQDRLSTIAALPPTPQEEHATPDWTTWWCDQRQTRIGVHRPQDHDPQQDPVSHDLNRVIAHMAEAAVPHLPTPPQIAQHINNHAPRTRKTPSAQTQLSAVYTAAFDIHHLARRLSLPKDQLTVLCAGDPETMTRTLREHGLNIDQDIGTVTTLEALKSLLSGRGTKQLRISIPTRIWHRTDVQDSYKITPTDNVYSTGMTNSHILRDAENTGSRSHTEWRLMSLTTPKVPLHSHTTPTPHSPDPQASELAFLTGTTPNAASGYLHDLTDSPLPSQDLGQCPLISQCPSVCAQLQATGKFAFPLTPDGRHQSCHYWQFLQVHLNSPPPFRESAAAQELKRQQELLHHHYKTNSKTNRTQHPSKSEDDPAQTPVPIAQASQQNLLF